MLEPGTRLGRYTVRERLGAGGMGEVYRAADELLGRDVALKVLAPDVASEPERLARFVREAKAASALNHPNILTVYDFGEHDGTPFIVTELVDGLTLREWARFARPSVAALVDAVRQAALALSAAHRAGIVHRDVKPENVMRRHDGYVKVLDFGLAKLVAEDSAGAAADAQFLTMPGAVLGTVRYMSPEQALGTPVDARSDVWSLGVVLYELLADRPPFDRTSVPATLVEIVTREAASLASLAPGAPEAVRGVAERAMRKAREERYATAAEMAEALAAAGRELDAAGEKGTAILSTTRDAEGAERRATTPTTDPPSSGSRLIGRERALADLGALLRRSDVRLVTVTGAGGTGKTRLAVEAARLALADFADGMLVVDLAAISDPGLLADRIAHVADVKEGPGAPVAGELLRHLSAKRLLLLLDNFEHLLDGAPFVSELLAAAPGLVVLATSRALLRISDEREYPLEPLDVPTFTILPPLDELARSPAVALFVERAREAKPSFAITAENAGAVVEICRRLDGLPLALELAAARVKLLSPASILGRLDHRLKLLTGGARDLPMRQQTMRGAVAWSYDLLDDGERETLERLAVFAGGSTIEAAEAVCASGEADVLDAIGSLVDKSLLRRREREDGEMRVTMLEVVREYALERLEASGRVEAARLEHARFFAALAEEANEKIRGEEQVVWLDRLTRELDNIRAALATLLDRSAAEGATLVVSVYVFWYYRGLYTEARGWLAKALGAAPAPPMRARMLGQLSQIELRLGEPGATERAREAVEASRETGDPRLVMSALGVLGYAFALVENVTEARRAFEEGLELARELGDTFRVSAMLGSLGDVARVAGDLAGARDYLEQSLEAAGPHLRNHDNAIVRLNLGSIAVMEGDHAGAGPYLREALSIARELGNLLIASAALDGLADLALDAGKAALAARAAGAAESLRAAGGTPLELGEIERHERFRASLDEALGAESLEREWASGSAMSLDEAARMALGDA
jgi:predicted ATPase